MKNTQFILLVACCIGFVTLSHAQRRNYRIQNGIGISGGVTQFDINTNNFNTKAGNGFYVGLTASANLPHKWYNVSYNIQLLQNKIDIEGREAAVSANRVDLEYKQFAAQISFLMHVKPINKTQYFTIDVGPMLQYNGKLELQEGNQSNFYINNYANLTAKAIEDVSKFNINGVAGVSAGFKQFKLKAHYMYGFLNTLDKLNSGRLDTTGGSNNFKGNPHTWLFGGTFIF